MEAKQKTYGYAVKKDGRDMLLDSWEVNGTNKSDMIRYLRSIDNMTKLFPASSDSIEIFTVNCIEDNSIVGFRHGSVYGTSTDLLSISKLAKLDGMTEEILSETINDSKMILKVGNDTFFTSKKILTTLSQRAGSSISKLVKEDDMNIRFHRDAAYVSYMSMYPSRCNILTRKYANAKKILAIFTDRYTVISQSGIIENLINIFEKKFGKSTVYYKINNFMTEINIEFPNAYSFKSKESVVPGIRVVMSDTGDAVFSITATIRIRTGLSYIPGAYYTRKHTLNASVNEITEEASDVIIPEIQNTENIIERLSKIEIKDMETVIKKTLNGCGLKSSISAKVHKDTLSYIMESVPQSGTAFDVACSIVEACDYMAESSCDLSSEKFRTCSAKSIFCKYA